MVAQRKIIQLRSKVPAQLIHNLLGAEYSSYDHIHSRLTINGNKINICDTQGKPLGSDEHINRVMLLVIIERKNIDETIGHIVNTLKSL